MSEMVNLPRKPTPEMLRAIEVYFERWQKIAGCTDTTLKANCWQALMCYHAMVQAYEKAIAAPQETPGVPDESESPAVAAPEPDKSIPAEFTVRVPGG